MININTYSQDGDKILTFKVKDFDPERLPTVEGPNQIFLFHDQNLVIEEDGLLCQDISPSSIAGITMIDNAAQSCIEFLYKEGYNLVAVHSPIGAPRMIYYGHELHGKKLKSGFMFTIDGKKLYLQNMPYIVIRRKS